MFEVWEITEGPGKGELLIAEVGEDTEFPGHLRDRLRKASDCPFKTEREANSFRREWADTITSKHKSDAVSTTVNIH